MGRGPSQPPCSMRCIRSCPASSARSSKPISDSLALAGRGMAAEAAGARWGGRTSLGSCVGSTAPHVPGTLQHLLQVMGCREIAGTAEQAGDIRPGRTRAQAQHVQLQLPAARPDTFCSSRPPAGVPQSSPDCRLKPAACPPPSVSPPSPSRLPHAHSPGLLLYSLC